jgi:bifunctional non-homologous end joining protein LigD
MQRYHRRATLAIPSFRRSAQARMSDANCSARRVRYHRAMPRDQLPPFVAPQLAEPVKTPPEGPNWAHEVKHDGYRIHARLSEGRVKLLTRTGLDWTDRYDTTARLIAKIAARSAYVDGELCAVRGDGTTSFAELQAATDSQHTTNLVYFMFDLLFLDGENLMDLPLLERRDRLQRLLKKVPAALQYSDHHIGDGKRILAAACNAKAEGIVSKRIDAKYVPGNRGLWRKVKCVSEEEFIIVGYSDAEGSRLCFGALLLAYYDDQGRLLYAGRVGTGFSDRELHRLYDLLQPLRIGKAPLDVTPPRTTRFGSPLVLSRVHWVRPERVCVVTYLTWTADGLLRQVAYQGLREDKTPKDVRRPTPA